MRMDRVIVPNELLDLHAQHFFVIFFLSKEIRYKLHMIKSLRGREVSEVITSLHM
jgi:hypothetical protein